MGATYVMTVLIFQNIQYIKTKNKNKVRLISRL